MVSTKNTGSGSLNLGMHQLVTKERERLGVRFVCDHEIWQDKDTALPGYEGYEHFTVDRGYALLADDGGNFKFVSESTRKCYPTNEQREEVFKRGYEFISIMKLAALSIGSAAVYSKESFSDLTDLFPPPGTDLFWQHLIQSWVSLSMSADRLRTFFIQFVRCEIEKKVDDKLRKLKKRLEKKGDQQPKQFVFIEAFKDFEKKPLTSTGSQRRLIDLQELLEGIATIRLERNSFIHDFASREAMVVAAQRDSGSDHAGVFKAFMGDKPTSDYIEELANAYKVLVRAGNLIFLLEKDVTEGNPLRK